MDFARDVRSVKWEFGYWGETLDTWYAERLCPERTIPRSRVTSLHPRPTFTPAPGRRLRGKRLPKGMPVMAGGLYWPTQGFPLDSDVRARFGMDATQRLVDVNLLFCPMFDAEIFEEDENRAGLHGRGRGDADTPQGGSHHAVRGTMARHGLEKLEQAQGGTPFPEGYQETLSPELGRARTRLPRPRLSSGPRRLPARLLWHPGHTSWVTRTSS